MPQIPTFQSSEAPRLGPAARADSAAIAAPGAALSRVAGDVGDVMAQFNARYQEARRQADVSNTIAGASQQLGDLQHQWSLTPDRQQAIDGFNQDAAKIRTKALDGVTDPLAQSMIERGLDQEILIRGSDTAKAAFARESSKRRGDLDQNLLNYAQSAATTDNTLLRGKIQDDATAAIHGAVAAGWMDPEDGEKTELNFRSQVQEVKVRQLKNAALATQDPNAMDALSKRLSDPTQFPGLLPERREILAQGVETIGYRLEARAAARQAHADAMNAKWLRQTQQDNETQLLMQVYKGQKVDMGDLEDLALHHQISPSGLEAIHSAIDRVDAGHDDAMAVVHLWQKIGNGTAAPDDIYGAMQSGQIKGTTAAGMMRSLNERSKQGDNAAEKTSFTQLKTALSGAAVENGTIDIMGANKGPIAQRWAQAVGEWNDRVIINHEDPQKVVADMIPRYNPQISAPVWLHAPKLGAVTSSAELQAVALRTYKAFQAHQIDEATYHAQVELLNQYKSFYRLHDAAQQARAGVKPNANNKTRNVGVAPEASP